MTGVRACRKLDTACRDQIPYLWLTGWQHPVGFYQRASTGHEEAVRTHCAYGGDHAVGGPAGQGGGWYETEKPIAEL